MQPPNPFEEEKGEARSTNSTAGNTPTEARANLTQRTFKTWQMPIDRINSFINALAESRLSVSVGYVVEMSVVIGFFCFRIRT